MLSFPPQVRVFASLAPTDMRKSFDELVGIVEKELGQDVQSGNLFLFFNRRHDRVKVHWFAGDGLVIWYKRLEWTSPRAASSTWAAGLMRGVTSMKRCW